MVQPVYPGIVDSQDGTLLTQMWFRNRVDRFGVGNGSGIDGDGRFLHGDSRSRAVLTPENVGVGDHY